MYVIVSNQLNLLTSIMKNRRAWEAPSPARKVSEQPSVGGFGYKDPVILVPLGARSFSLSTVCAAGTTFGIQRLAMERVERIPHVCSLEATPGWNAVHLFQKS